MSRLELFSEPFAKTGNIAAEGFRKLLGRPALGLLQTALREALQNSIDAGQIGQAPSILIRYRLLSPAQRKALGERVLRELPLGDETRTEMENSLGKAELWVLEICDFGTTGLGGPTRADVPPEDGCTLDFVNFMRNVGAARDTHHGGGTYGYGKTSLYAMSACSTIIVDSQTTDGEKPGRRLMGCHLGSAFEADIPDLGRKRFTGRHWWGMPDGEGAVDPATGGEAVELSGMLGMPQRDLDRFGTTILILDPRFGGENKKSIADEIIETILWNFWPRMAETTPSDRKLDVRIEIEGEEVLIPSPENFPPLDLFSQAMAIHRAGGERVEIIRSERPRKDLGALVMQRGLCGGRSGPARREGSLIPAQASHIALMRPVELVVKYIVGEPFPDRRFEWVGAFICSDDEDVEDAFASAEPPAHDDWIPDMLPKGSAKTYVNVALKRLVSQAKTYAAPLDPGTLTTGGRGPSLAHTATRLGRILDTVSGKGPGRPKQPSPRPLSRRKSLSVTPPRFVRLELDANGEPLALFEAQVQNDGSDAHLRLLAAPHLVVDGGATGTDGLPKGYETNVVSIALDAEGMTAQGPILEIGKSSGTVSIRVRSPRDAAIGLRLNFLKGRDE